MSKNRLTVPQIRSRKGEVPLVVLTAYTAPFARIIDVHCDILLVGDSLGMVLYGMKSPLGVTLDMMINHGKAVVNSSSVACVVIDMPFGSYQGSREQAFNNAARVMAETGAAAVKIEGGKEMAETISYLVERGIPVMGHVGLQPQRVNQYGGFKTQGKDDAARKKILEDALAVEKAGAFSIVLEAVYSHIGEEITAKTKVPVIGIGAGVACDGQVLVTEDMMGLNTDYTPTFVKKYASLADDLSRAAKSFSDDVKGRKFPDAKHSFSLKARQAA